MMLTRAATHINGEEGTDGMRELGKLAGRAAVRELNMAIIFLSVDAGCWL